MQKARNLVINTITDENKKDMQMRCQDLRHLNTLRGKILLPSIFSQMVAITMHYILVLVKLRSSLAPKQFIFLLRMKRTEIKS